MLETVNILGVKVNNITLNEAREKVLNFLNSIEQKMIFTPNPEIIVKAQTDKYFLNVLNSGDLNLPDGRGLQLATFNKIKIIPGSDFMIEICGLAQKNNSSIFLLGSGFDNVINKTKENLLKQFPSLKIAGVDKGKEVKENPNGSLECVDNNFILEKIKVAQPDVLFVAFGMGKQEKWIYENLSKLSSVKIAMGVGGTFDFLAGKITRAPQIFRVLWLEWLWRLFKEPKRLGRIYNATIKFLYLIIKAGFKK